MKKNNVEELTLNLIMQNYNERNYKTITRRRKMQNDKKIKNTKKSPKKYQY